MAEMRKTASAAFVLIFAFAALVATALEDGEGAGRRFAFEYEVVVPAEVEGAEVLTLFVPIADDTTGQRILSVDLDASEGVEGRFGREARHGNKYWVAELPAKRAKPFRVAVRYDVERAVVRAGDERGDADSAKAFLGPDQRVPVGHPVLEPILEEIRAASPGGSKSERARAIYDWVVDNVEYKKTGTGWGNGDTFWACNERYGNCTDFHSLFISLARTEGIPARFEMGFPVPADRESGTIAGYHCWVEFWLPGEGWVPIDASEASKHPDKRELFYGTHPADRLQLSRGRDLRLGEDHRGRTLNYFVYPYLEGDGKRLDAPLETRFSYE
ncbi:MAG: transglutaminase-like domain-containing protein [bacterium]|nr:transglutaminase-like domain-containing protein [bacterium]